MLWQQELVAEATHLMADRSHRGQLQHQTAQDITAKDSHCPTASLQTSDTVPSPNCLLKFESLGGLIHCEGRAERSLESGGREHLYTCTTLSLKPPGSNSVHTPETQGNHASAASNCHLHSPAWPPALFPALFPPLPFLFQGLASS